MNIKHQISAFLLQFLIVQAFCTPSAFSYGSKLAANDLKRLELKIDKLHSSFLAEMAELDRKGIGTDGNVACEVCRVYGKKIELLKIDALHPDDLATLALWAEQKRHPSFCAPYVYENVFETNVSRLGRLRNNSARAALQRVKLGVKKRGHLDGHIGETIAEAEQDSVKK